MIQTILGQTPSKEWKFIPDFNNKYIINISGDIMAFYRYKGSFINPHYELLKPDGGSIILSLNKKSKKYCIDLLIDMVFGKQQIENLEGEIWKDVKDYEPLYRISNYGRISCKRIFIERSNGVTQFRKEKIINPNTINSGYDKISLYSNKKPKSFLVHRLVASHFISNEHDYEFVNHKDENKQNNCAHNLEWCTKHYNDNYGTCQERRVNNRRANNGGKY